MLALVAGCATTALPREPWRGYQLGNVTLLSGATQKRSEQIVDTLRKFRVVAAELTTADVIDPPVPTRVYVFPDGRSYTALTGSYDAAGRFIPMTGANVIVMMGTQGSGGEQLLLHEYTHLIVGSDDHHVYPSWYNEGLAEVLSTIRFRPDGVQVGHIRYEERDPAFAYHRWLPLERVFREDHLLIEDEHTVGRFYAQSWLLVHYAMFGPLEGKPDRGAELGRLVEAIAGGEHPVSAAKASLSVGLDELQTELREYVRDGAVPYLTYPAERFTWPTDPVPTFEVSPSRMGSHLAYVAAIHGQGDTAKRLVTDAQAAGDEGVQLELALAATTPADQLADINAHFEKAWEIEPDNVEVLVQYALWLLRTARDAPADYARKYRKRALRLGSHAVTSDSNSVAGHFVIGMACRELGGEKARSRHHLPRDGARARARPRRCLARARPRRCRCGRGDPGEGATRPGGPATARQHNRQPRSGSACEASGGQRDGLTRGAWISLRLGGGGRLGWAG